MSVLNDPKLEALLDTLHARSKAQEPETEHYWRTRGGDWHGMEARDHAHYADKFVALERDKAEFCYALCRAIGARRVVELGTSFGVSTLYLAAAVRDNIASSGGNHPNSSRGGMVIATEYEPVKAKAARANFAAAGLAEFIDLREGDLADTLKQIEGPLDFVLFDIWTDAVGPALKHVLPHLRTGAVMCADNTAGERSRAGYKALFDAIADPVNRLSTMTLPFSGGFEMTLRL
jgi:predicted O-methyltransferase YrrM